ncbi:MAG: T9SS type A sorting domain-containing protein [Bacteroidia bacterium]|jgi:ELWxxDGT repeat protein|nr:T9SS type A sorting domain-containing protein [Bacteroidia bacterium]
MMKQIYTHLAACLLATASLTHAVAQAPVLISDINRANRGTDPSEGASLANGKFICNPDVEEFGREPWVTDGTEAGTQMLVDIRKGRGSSNVQNFTSANNLVYFTADGDTTGTELWKTDGTPQGTVLVKDILPGPFSSRPRQLVFSNGILYFLAVDQTQEFQIWRSDGTEAGTFKLLPSNTVFEIGDLTVAGNDVYFTTSPARFNTFPRTLWKSNGTEVGTVQVTSFSSSSPYRFKGFGNKILFLRTTPNEGEEGWVSDGTAAGTILLKDIYPGTESGSPNFVRGLAIGNTFYFSASDSLHSRELWKTDGTEAGTVLVKDIYEGAEEGSDVNNMVRLGNLLLFSAVDSANGYELWKTDGTEAGTVVVKDIISGPEGSEPGDMFTVGNTVYFVAYTDEFGNELWKTDGTAAGTMLAVDLVPGEEGSEPLPFASLNGKLLFAAVDNVASRPELFLTDGTTAGTTLVKSIGGTLSSRVYSMTEVNGDVYFIATADDNDYFLFKTNGNVGNVVLVDSVTKSINGDLYKLGNKLVFSLPNDTIGQELFTYDPATNTFALIQDLNPGIESTFLDGPMVLFNNELYFAATLPNTGSELWKTDGQSISLVGDLFPGIEGSFPGNLKVIGNHLYFTAQDSAHGTELWRTDGSSISLFADIKPGVDPSYPESFVGVGNTIYVTAAGDDGTELFKIAGGVTTLVDLDVNSINAAYPYNLIVVGDKLFFNGKTDARGTELYVIRNDSLVLLHEMMEGTTGWGFGNGVAFDNQLYYTTTTLTNGVYDYAELWRTDGYVFKKVVDILPGYDGSNPNSFVVMGCNLLFKATTPQTGTELWKVSKGVDTAVLVADIVSGPNNSDLSQFTAINGTLYFRASTPATEEELWVYQPTLATTVTQATICFGDTFVFNGIARTESGVYNRFFTTAQGCDSIQSLNLTVKPELINNLTYDLCFGTSVRVGSQVIDTAGVFQFKLVTREGCDSTVIVNVGIKPQINLVTSTATTISASTDSATYQWINCADNTPASGNATQQTYEPAVSGSYAVIVTKNGCIDTSDCVTISLVGIEELAPRIVANAYPNPNRGSFTLTTNNEATFNVLNQLGQLVQTVTLDAGNNYRTEISNLQSGVYMLVNATNGYTQSLKIVVTQ